MGREVLARTPHPQEEHQEPQTHPEDQCSSDDTEEAMNDPHAETDVWPTPALPARPATHSPERASEAPAGVQTDQGTREALVEQLAEAIEDVLSDEYGTFLDGGTPSGIARLVSAQLEPVVATRVEAAVSEVRAERDRAKEYAEEYDAILSRQGDLLTRTVNVLRGDPPPLTSWSHHDVPELAQELADQMAKVKALAAEHDHCSGCPTPWWLRTALSDPTTPDQAGGA